MRNLLSAGMFRLLKSKLLYVALGASILLEVYTLLPERDRLRLLAIPLEKAVFAYPLFIVLIVPSFCGLFFGAEYGSGTLRNKVAAGIAKRDIYLTNLLVAMGVAMVLTLASLLTGLALGFFFQGEFQNEPAEVVAYVICSLGVDRKSVV